MKEKKSSSISMLCKTLIRPDLNFQNDNYLKVSLFVIMLALYILTLTSAMGGRLVMDRPEMAAFSENIALRNLEKSMHGCTEEQIKVAKENTLKGMRSPIGKIAAYISICVTSVFIFVRVLLFWLFQVVVLKFMGGEESPTIVKKKKKIKTYKNRKSLIFAVISSFPGVIYSIIGVLVIFTKDSKSLVNVLTMEDLMESFNIQISLSGLFLNNVNLPVFFRNVLDSLTGPFYWWYLIIAWYGLKRIWRIDNKKCVIFLSMWLLLFNGVMAGYEHAMSALF